MKESFIFCVKKREGNKKIKNFHLSKLTRKNRKNRKYILIRDMFISEYK